MCFGITAHPVQFQEANLKGYKTLAFALAIAIGGVLQTFNWATIIPQDQTWSGLAMLAIGAVVAALRYVTTSSVLKSQ